MGYESEMYQEMQTDIKPRLAAIEKHLGINQPPVAKVESEPASEDLLKEEIVSEPASGPGEVTGEEKPADA